jgi:hypothetical protein
VRLTGSPVPTPPYSSAILHDDRADPRIGAGHAFPFRRETQRQPHVFLVKVAHLPFTFTSALAEPIEIPSLCDLRALCG